MKTKNKLISFISIVLCVCVIFGCGTVAKAETDVDNVYHDVYTENKSVNIFLDFTKVFCDFLFSVHQNNESVSNGKGDIVKVRSPFIIVPFQETPGFLSNIKSLLWIFTKVKVLKYSGDYTYVEVVNTGEKGYIFYYFLDDNRNGELTLTRENDNVYVGKTNSGRLKATYTGDDTLTWSVEPAGYIVRDANTGIITGIKPGIVTVTVKAGESSEQCTVSCINEWKETETATAQKSITIRANPGSSYASKGTIPKGATITALGDLADGSGWIYVEANGIWGFIQLSDFPGIDYLMTQYHYFDKGFETRFDSSITKISDYTSVLNKKMLELFGLKVCSYVYEYKSVADQCKIWRYGSVETNNISSSCPKIKSHKTDSCLKTEYLRDELNNIFGNGGGIVSKVAWTGHIMADHNNDRSNATVGMGTIIITPYKTVKKTSSGYVNDSSYEIRRDSISTLMHETIHQLGVLDHYCYDDQGGKDGKRCSNDDGCYICYGNGIEPDCMMMVNKYPTEDSNLLCNKCKSSISQYLSNNF